MWGCVCAAPESEVVVKYPQFLTNRKHRLILIICLIRWLDKLSIPIWPSLFEHLSHKSDASAGPHFHVRTVRSALPAPNLPRTKLPCKPIFQTVVLLRRTDSLGILAEAPFIGFHSPGRSSIAVITIHHELPKQKPWLTITRLNPNILSMLFA